MLPHEILWIPFPPLASALVLLFFSRRFSARAAAAIACLAPLLSFGAAAAAAKKLAASSEPLTYSLGTWLSAGGFSTEFSFRVDALSAVLTLVVTGVGFLIHVYSIGYMRHDPGVKRYFAYLNLFVGAMLILATAETLPLLFLGWEGVGLCSYLLIGFWYEDPEKAAAGLKAFLVNKAADVAFLSGMLLLGCLYGTLDIPSLESAVRAGAPADEKLLSAATLLLFVGACGKSAQIFLHVWLPDAMAGPTPVSALIHAATMVTAGAYLVARLHFLFAPGLMTTDLVAVVGVMTALYAALAALAQTDIKRVLAYSTVSQLGFLFLGLGVGAFPASLFHLVTHAFFKATLFLAAGSVIHALAGEQNICRMGNGLWRKIPLTFACATAGVLGAVAFPFAGFLSKHQILHAAGEARVPLAIFGNIASVLTAVYLARWWLQVFFARNDSHAASHAHESPLSMTVPMAILAGGALAGGFLNWPAPGGGKLETFLAPVFPYAERHEVVHLGASLAASLYGPAAVLILGWLYAKRPPFFAATKRFLAPLREAAAAGFYVDELYEDLIVRPAKNLSVALWAFLDMLAIDGLLHLAAGALTGTAALTRKLSTGQAGSGLWIALAGAAALFVGAAWGLR